METPHTENKYTLPLNHPDYEYPEARNIYAERLKKFSGKVFSDRETETFKNHWKSHFPELPASSELHIEIGCNTGHVVRAHAKNNPQIAYIGIDWKFKAIHTGLEKAEKAQLKNIIFLRANAVRFPYIFGKNEVDRISVFFPDPWPKKSQWKNRHLKREALEHFHHCLKSGGILHLKTDHDGYFDWILEHLEPIRNLWEIQSETRDLHANHPNPQTLEIPEVTLFEKIFIKEGIKIKQLILVKK